jgi:hypothetical protein
VSTRIFVAETEVVPLLTRMRLPRWVILELVSSVAGERANVSPDDPPGATGYESWRWGTRFSREHEALKTLGWVACEKDQISGIRNAASGIKLVVCNTDSNTGNPFRSPKNLCEKGAASCRLIDKNSGQIPMRFIQDEIDDDLWYLCQFSGTVHSIEISRPSSEVAGTITKFSDRIIIARPGEIPGIRRVVVPQEFADVPRPRASRKRP